MPDIMHSTSLVTACQSQDPACEVEGVDLSRMSCQSYWSTSACTNVGPQCLATGITPASRYCALCSFAKESYVIA